MTPPTKAQTAIIFDFIKAAAKITGFEFDKILYPKPEHRRGGRSADYSLCCRIRWLASIHAEESGLTKRQIIDGARWNSSVPYVAWKELPSMKLDKPLCRILREVLATLTPISAPVVGAENP